MPVTKPDGTLVLALVRGDDRLSDMKLYDAIPGESRPATDEEIRAAFGAGGGSLGPVGFSGEVIADKALLEGQFVAGANRDGFHLRGVEAGRDYEPRFADLREPKSGDACPNCGGALRFQTAVEVGHIFNFGSFYSRPLEATFLDRGRPREAAARRKLRDRPRARGGRRRSSSTTTITGSSGRPRSLRTTCTSWRCPARRRSRHARPSCFRLRERTCSSTIATCARREVRRRGPDRLSGRVTAGKKSLDDGAVDVRDRATGEERRVKVDEL
jgi:hypothetical protein